jgi:murein L,D-transpeptidase YafK
MRLLPLTLCLVATLALSGCASKFKTYRGPEVTSVQVHKSARKMYLLHGNRALEVYDIGLGFAPDGHKQFEGDGKTPEGLYFIDRRNPESEYHLSIGLSYPNPADIAFAEAAEKEPGGDIFIHGGPKRPVSTRDWTLGCIAVSDKEMEWVYAMVKDGTPVYVLP